MLKDYVYFIKILTNLDEILINTDQHTFNELCKNILNDMIYGSKITDNVDILFLKKLIYQFVVEKVYFVKKI